VQKMTKSIEKSQKVINFGQVRVTWCT